MARVWQDEWQRAADGISDHRLFVEEGSHADYLSGIEIRLANKKKSACLRKSIISADMFERIKLMIPAGRMIP